MKERNTRDNICCVHFLKLSYIAINTRDNICCVHFLKLSYIAIYIYLCMCVCVCLHIYADLMFKEWTRVSSFCPSLS